MPLFLLYVITLRCPQNVYVKFQIKIPHRSVIILFCCWKQKHNVFAHVSLNANELLLPALFYRIGLCLRNMRTGSGCHTACNEKFSFMSYCTLTVKYTQVKKNLSYKNSQLCL